ncbi:helicase-related protein [Krasilnikovia sp. MM14-A1259]|uniref:helicase-related protein n=1 Tax=Krasilnikovia sp. MM14-A1259 TaxID=3373539 RepID=UPI003804CE8E
MTTTTGEPAAAYPPGARIEVRDEEWLVRSASPTAQDGYRIEAIGVSELVLDDKATFFDAIDTVMLLRPEETQLVADETPNFRRSRLYLEAVLRRTPLPRAETGLALAKGFLRDPLTYQTRPVELALRALRPRVLIADVVGLGKTLEIGLLLAELIRRGRGERLLVVTPQHVLEQFQHELWTRFSIPLVRLDSVGIQRIQQEIPAGRNPFTYFKRVIVSVDTLKDTGAYGHHLDAIDWDAVVIDESHNLIGASLRNKLARRLAPRTDALILASATPHNGDKKSFAELISLLDPAAIADARDYSAADIEHLYIRRTKISPEVRDQIGKNWSERGPSVPVHCQATDAEERVFAELTTVWLSHASGGSRRDRLFPYTLMKAFLSSHHALLESVDARLRNADGTERSDLLRLRGLAEAIPDDESAKLGAMVDYLKDIGVKPRGDTRVVVFSERVRTLRWLADTVPARLGFPAGSDAIRVMHGGLTDTEQQRIVEEFTLAGSPVRLLFTGDVASEGVNLHRECHYMVHYDIPWSLIRIEQRNGRIDRYGQEQSPQFRALILTSKVPDALDDRTVAEKLLLKEEAAHRSLGTAEAVTGLYDAKKEEDRLTLDLLRGRTVEESIEPAEERDVLADLLAGFGEAPTTAEVPTVEVPTLFTSTARFVDEALRELYGPYGDVLDLAHEDELLSFDAPKDLERRLLDLPRTYLAAHRNGERLRLKLTFDRELAQRKLDEARKSKQTIWPEIGYLSDIHPVVDWLIDKVLIRLGRQQAPVLHATVEDPVFLVQGVYCNRLGQPTVVEWMAISGLPEAPVVRPMPQVLAAAGVRPSMPNPNRLADFADLQGLVPDAIQVARKHLAGRLADWEQRTEEPLTAHRRRLERWEQASLVDVDTPAPLRAHRDRKVRDTAAAQRNLINLLETSGEPLLRLLAVLVGGAK